VVLRDETLKKINYLINNKHEYERMKMPKYKVTVDRVQCIGCGIAPNLCPQVFVLGDDNGMNRVVDEYSEELSAEVSVGLVPEDLRDCVEKAAEACPAQAITFEETA
jgi:ferredoxin